MVHRSQLTVEHAFILLPTNLPKKPFLQKVGGSCFKFGEDQSKTAVTTLSTDGRTDRRMDTWAKSDFIFCPLRCITLVRQSTQLTYEGCDVFAFFGRETFTFKFFLLLATLGSTKSSE